MKSTYLTCCFLIVFTGFSSWSFPTNAEQLNLGASRVPFTTISRGLYCGHTDTADSVITNQEDWANLWQQINPSDEGDADPEVKIPLPPPEVDFTRYTVIAVFMGEQPTDGHSITVFKVKEVGSALKVFVKSASADSSCQIAQVKTQPYHIVEIDKTEKEVRFNVRQVTEPCE